METSTIRNAPPEMWSIERAGGHPPREFLHFGRNRVALADIKSVSGEEEKSRPIDGLLISATVFLALATIFAFGVLEDQWLPRFLLGAGFMAFLGLIGIIEVARVKPQRLFRVRIGLNDGRAVTFASTNLDDVQRLMARIAPAS